MGDEEPVAKRARTMTMNINAIVSKSSETKSFQELTASPLSTLIGLAHWTDDVSAQLKINTIGGLGKWKYFLWARALVALAAKEVPGHRDEDSKLNANKALDAAHENKSFHEILALPPSALQGLAEKHDELLEAFHIKTIQDLGTWKYGTLANAIVTLAELETEDVEAHT